MSQTLSRGNRRRSKAFVARSSASTRRSVPSVLIGLARWRGLSALARIVVKLRNSLASHDKRTVRETAIAAPNISLNGTPMLVRSK